MLVPVVHIARGWWFSAIGISGLMVSDTWGIWSGEMRRVPDRSGVVELTKAIERAWNAGDVKSYAQLYANDAEYVTRSGILWKGRKAIERGHVAAFRGELKRSVLEIRIKRLRFLTAKAAVAHCAIELSEGAKERRRTIRAVTRFEQRKTSARWEIIAARTREIPVR
jgi:uncharacterized protein (TIGR02246 family)